ALVPRLRDQPAGREPGQSPEELPGGPPDPTVAARLPERRHHPHRPGRELPGRWPAGRTRPPAADREEVSGVTEDHRDAAAGATGPRHAPSRDQEPQDALLY